MKDYHKLEEDLFARWQAKSNQLEKEKESESLNVVKDGMMYRGKITFEKDDWDREQGDEYERWESAPLRLLMLTKENISDCGDNDSWDKRQEIACNNKEAYEECRTTYPKFYKNYIRWIYCMLKPEKVNGLWQAPSFDEASDWKKSMRYMTDEAPLVRMNVKKQSGGTSITNSVLESYINDYADEIIEQINIYDANIIFCCGHGSLIRPLLKERVLPDLEQVDEKGNWMYYSPTRKVLVVDGYHPSQRTYTHEDVYNWLKEAYEDFLQQYPGFPMGI